MNEYFKRALRILQKVPGINLVEYLPVGNVCYVVNPKAASRTLIFNLVKWETGKGGKGDAFFWSRVRIAPYWYFRRDTRNLKYFSALRDEDARLYSCWREKLQIKDKRGRFMQQYFVLYWPWIRFGMPYDAFRRVVQRIPEGLREKHFMSQKHWLRTDRIPYERLFDIAKMEELDAWLGEELEGYSTRRKLNSRAKRTDIAANPYE